MTSFNLYEITAVLVEHPKDDKKTVVNNPYNIAVDNSETYWTCQTADLKIINSVNFDIVDSLQIKPIRYKNV